MKLKDYIKDLQALVKKYPNAEVVYSIDEEGNAFHPVEMAPAAGCYDKDSNGFQSEQYKGEDTYTKTNAVCIN